MRVMFVTRGEFELLFTRAFPAERMCANLPAANLMITSDSTLILCKEECRVCDLGVSIVDMSKSELAHALRTEEAANG